MRSAVVWLVLTAVVLSAPVPKQEDVSGRPKILENSMEVQSLNSLMRDCRRCHGMFPSHKYEMEGDRPPKLFDKFDKLRIDYLNSKPKKEWMANGINSALNANWMYQPISDSEKRGLRHAEEWLRRE